MDEIKGHQAISRETRRIAEVTSHFQKVKYLLDLSEDDFRDKAVRPLFRRLGYDDGCDTCGPSEEGKDCWVTRADAIAGVEITAIQTKRGKLTMSSVPTDNIRSIITQMRTALDTRITYLATKQRLFPDRVFLIASGAISNSVKEHIASEITDPRLRFLEGEDLLRLLDKHYPEVWLNIYSEVVPYLQAVCAALEEGHELFSAGLNLATGGGSYNATVDALFANVTVYRPSPRTAPAPKGKRRKTTPRADVPITGIASRQERLVLLIGEGGSGKSTALKRMLYEIAKKPFSDRSSLRIPVLLKARDVAADLHVPILDHVARMVKRLGPTLRLPMSEEDLSEGRVIFMIDAIDELADPEAERGMLAYIRRAAEEYPRCQFIITSRYSDVVQRDRASDAFVKFFLSPLRADEIQKLIRGYATRQRLNLEDSAEILKRIQDIHGVSMSPLIVTIFIGTSDINRSDIPANITELFRKYTEQMLGRWDESKGLAQQYQFPVKDFIVSQIAFEMHASEDISIPLEDFKNRARTELESRGLVEEVDALLNEILRSNLFQIKDDRIEFRHLILQEFFAGRAIPSFDVAVEKVTSFWWRSALVFYFGANPSDAASIKRLADTLPSLRGRELSNAIRAIGLSLQACYLTHVDEKRKVFEIIVNALAKVTVEHGFDSVFDQLPNMRLLSTLWIHRDSVGLHALHFFVEDLYAEIERVISEKSLREIELFWVVVGLCEAGAWPLVNVYVRRYKPDATIYELAILIELRMARATRLFTTEDAELIDRLMVDLEKRMGVSMNPLIRRIDSEYHVLIQTAHKALPRRAGSASASVTGDNVGDESEDEVEGDEST
jgi:hypothetical protein